MHRWDTNTVRTTRPVRPRPWRRCGRERRPQGSSVSFESVPQCPCPQPCPCPSECPCPQSCQSTQSCPCPSQCPCPATCTQACCPPTECPCPATDADGTPVPCPSVPAMQAVAIPVMPKQAA